MAWLDDHNAEVLRNFRARFTYQAWQLFRTGQCSWQPAPPDTYCKRSRQQRHVYCQEHTRGLTPSAALVPASVCALGTELPE